MDSYARVVPVLLVCHLLFAGACSGEDPPGEENHPTPSEGCDAGDCTPDDADIADIVDVGDGDASPEEVSIEEPPCQGTVCGAYGELCCEGQTPICSPAGGCVQDCPDGGPLCGEEFDECCAAGDLCLFGECRSPGDECESSGDCGDGEYCEEVLSACLPDDFSGDLQCQIPELPAEFEPVEKWSWTGADIITIPVVGDVTGDGEPNVVVNTASVDGGSWDSGQIVILDSGGHELRRVEHEPNIDSWGSNGRSTIALADVTGDGAMEIIYASRTVDGDRGYIVAVDGDGHTLWRAHDEEDTPVAVTVDNGAITVANFDGDPETAELAVGAMLIDSDGRVVWNDGGDGPIVGSNERYVGGIAAVADLTSDGTPELVTGKQAWRVEWAAADEGEDEPDVVVSPLWEHDGPDGYPAVADINGDGTAEVVLVAAQTLRVLDGETGKLFCGIDPSGEQCDDDDKLRTPPIELPGPENHNRGGPPVIADFDGDNRPEIGVAGGHQYTVFDIFRPGFGDDPAAENIDYSLLAEFEQPQPSPGELFVRWTKQIQDLSDNTSGSSAFDFWGHGAASVLFGDECFMRIYSGVDGEVEHQIPSSNGVFSAYPMVADVDGDGSTELLVVANARDYCSSGHDGYEARQGLFVYEDPADRWVRTRSIWNQHAHFIDHINDDGSMPDAYGSWSNSHNTFRINLHGEAPLDAADVVVKSVQVDPRHCPPQIDLQIAVQNHGLRATGEELEVAVYDSDEGQSVAVQLEEPIIPGGTAVVEASLEVSSESTGEPLTLQVVANDDGIVDDCNPDSASVVVDGVECLHNQ